MKILHYLTIATLALLCSGFASCEKSDTPEVSDLTGKWQNTWSKGYEKDLENLEDPEFNESWDKEGEPSVIVVFAADGTGYFADSGENDTFTWRLDGSNLALSDTFGDEEIFTIKQLDAKTLVIVVHEQEPGYEYYSEETYTKMN